MRQVAIDYHSEADNENSKILQHLFMVSQNLPCKNEEVFEGLFWGDCCQLYTPAFWKIQYELYMLKGYMSKSFRLTSTLLEEIVLCLTGGYGIRSEIGLIAFQMLKDNDLIKPGVGFYDIYDLLSSPFRLTNGKKIKYRFYNQKSKYIYKLLNKVDLDNIPIDNDIELRRWLTGIEGIGLKTASWITRNWLDSNNVAILDIHILRAGILTGFFSSTFNVNKDYIKLEENYLRFCTSINVSAGEMDAVIWDFMKKNNRFAIETLNSNYLCQETVAQEIHSLVKVDQVQGKHVVRI